MFVIRRLVGGMPEYLSFDRLVAVSGYAWVSDRALAIGFADQKSAEDFRNYLRLPAGPFAVMQLK